MHLNDVKLRLMQADARLSTVTEKLLCDDEHRKTDTLYITTHTLNTHAYARILSDLSSHSTLLSNAFHLLLSCMWLCRISPSRTQTHASAHAYQGC